MQVNDQQRLRVRYRDGWTSVTASDGSVLLKAMEEEALKGPQSPRLFRALERLSIRASPHRKHPSPPGGPVYW